MNRSSFSPPNECPIWGTDCRVVRSWKDASIYIVGGPFRAGVDSYQISADAYQEVPILEDSEKARLTSMLIEQWMGGVRVPSLTSDGIKLAKERLQLPVYQRAERLLKLLGSRSSYVGELLDYFDGDPDGRLYCSALAWSESTSETELDFLTDYLDEQGWVAKKMHPSRNSYSAYSLRMEVPGFRRIEELETNPDSTQCFLAMWFDDSMYDAREEGFKPAIREAGYRPLIIDEKPDLIGKIDDAIIANIRRSRFVVADFTHRNPEVMDGKCRETNHRGIGPRGGVYYEAGFAQGLGLQVIFTCRKDIVDYLHFDTRQFNHIVWESPKELRHKLTDRIVAAIGEGPLIK